MRGGISIIGCFIMLLLANAAFGQITGPENIFVAEPVRTLNYEVLNSSSEAKNLTLKVYCPAELRCEVASMPSAVPAGQKASFQVAFMPSDNAISNRYAVTLIGNLGEEVIEKRIEVAIGIPEIKQPSTNVSEPEQSGSVSAPISLAVVQQTAILNILLAIIALLLFAMLILKLKGEKR